MPLPGCAARGPEIMNILASYNWLKEYVAFKGPAESFARQISLCGPSVERQHPQAPPFDDMVIGQVLELRPHPNAGKLRLVKTSLGKKQAEFVCGGVNLSVGMKVVVALPGAKVRWHGQGDLVELKAAEIRGVRSEGMICGASEIGLGEIFPHAEMEILDLSWCKSKPGTAFAKALGLDDTVFDVEVTTNRPDAFSIVGLAREAAAILGCKFSWKEPVIPSPAKSVKQRDIAVLNHASKLCSRYEAVVLENVIIGPSPWWVKNRLRMAGIRPINNVVDITNYVMIEYGQPLHAFDYDRVGGSTICVRPAKSGEKLLLLDGREAVLGEGQLVIADEAKPMAVAGVMGGKFASVHEETKTIVFESACFDPVSVRRTARALNTHTDSSLRFEKGLPEEQTHAALARAVELCQEIACGRLASQVVDCHHAPRKRSKFVFRPCKAEELIGVKIPRARMVGILKSLGFGVSPRSGTAKNCRYEVTVPYWRERDIETERDFAEEIARVYGYHNLPSLMPAGELPVEPVDPVLAAERRVREFLRGAGLTELLTYSFISRDQLVRCGFDPAAALRLANPLTADFEFMRPSLVPGLLAVISENQGLFPEASLFEVSNVYLPRPGDLPDERPRVLAAVYGPGKDAEALFRRIKGVFESYVRMAGLEGVELRRGGEEQLWHPGRGVEVSVAGQVLGRLGEIHPAVLARCGVDGRVAVMELDLKVLLAARKPVQRYQPVAAFPPVLRDMAFVLAERDEYGAVAKAVLAANELIKGVEMFDVYRGANLGAGKKSLALHLIFARPDRTLTAEEADKAIEDIKKAMTAEFGATIRS